MESTDTTLSFCAGNAGPCSGHDARVVTAVALPELELELEEPDVVPEPEEPDVVPELAPLDDVVVEPELDPVLAVDATAAAFAAALFTSAGSLPETSCTRIPPDVARSVAVAITTTRLRISHRRRLRALSRSATRPLASDWAGERPGGRGAPGSGSA
jgi:hypothetical protein